MAMVVHKAKIYKLIVTNIHLSASVPYLAHFDATEAA